MNYVSYFLFSSVVIALKFHTQSNASNIVCLTVPEVNLIAGRYSPRRRPELDPAWQRASRPFLAAKRATLTATVWAASSYCNTQNLWPNSVFILRHVSRRFDCCSAEITVVYGDNERRVRVSMEGNIWVDTNLFTPWSRVLLKKLTDFQLVKKFSAF